MSRINQSLQQSTFVTLDELAEPFSRYILEHLSQVGRQGTSKSSRFLDSLTAYNQGSINKSQMLEQTSRMGFINVIDAFHIVNQAETPIRFFIDEREKRNGITITDELQALKDTFQSQNFPFEIEARWRLVETAWSIGISPNLLVVRYDETNQSLFVEGLKLSRIPVTSCIDALNGYQKGKCFYCFKEISVNDCDVDHFFPFILLLHADYFRKININGVWNLVLACKDCNRGEHGKFARVPEIKYLELLNRRNSFLIDSHHPLRETLISQTGLTDILRREFLKHIDSQAIQYLIHRWKPAHELETAF